MAGVSEPEAVLYHGDFVAPDGYASRAANSFMAFQLRRPLVWIQIGLPLIFIPVISLAFDKYPYSVPIALGVDVFLVVGNVVSWITRRQNLTNQLTKSAEPGAAREISMTESTISIRTGDAFGQNPYRHFESAETYGDFVFIRVRGSSIRMIVPRELFTDESLAFLRSKVA